MTRRLWLINLLMLALIVAGLWQIRRNWLAADLREQAFLNIRAKAEAAVAPSIPPPQPPVNGAQYLEVASQLLLSKDRNPTVVVEVAAPKIPPPFPRFYGAMDFGDGLSVVLAEKGGAPQKSYKIGDTIGDFKILAVSRAGIDFEWDGKNALVDLDGVALRGEDAGGLESRGAAARDEHALPAGGRGEPGDVLAAGRRVGDAREGLVHEDVADAAVLVEARAGRGSTSPRRELVGQVGVGEQLAAHRHEVGPAVGEHLPPPRRARSGRT